MVNNKHKQCAKTLAEREQLSAILWAIIGVIQIISIAGIACGVWNVYCAYCRFKQSKAVLNPYPGLVESYDKWMTNIIISIVLNVVLGGVIGVAAAIFDMVGIRGYVLENKQIFEEMETDPSLAA